MWRTRSIITSLLAIKRMRLESFCENLIKLKVEELLSRCSSPLILEIEHSPRKHKNFSINHFYCDWSFNIFSTAKISWHKNCFFCARHSVNLFIHRFGTVWNFSLFFSVYMKTQLFPFPSNSLELLQTRVNINQNLLQIILDFEIFIAFCVDPI